jgi:hypothetical protein
MSPGLTDGDLRELRTELFRVALARVTVFRLFPRVVFLAAISHLLFERLASADPMLGCDEHIASPVPRCASLDPVGRRNVLRPWRARIAPDPIREPC